MGYFARERMTESARLVSEHGGIAAQIAYGFDDGANVFCVMLGFSACKKAARLF